MFSAPLGRGGNCEPISWPITCGEARQHKDSGARDAVEISTLEHPKKSILDLEQGAGGSSALSLTGAQEATGIGGMKPHTYT